MGALAQHRFGKVDALAHGGLHCTAMRLVIGMDLSHWTPLSLEIHSGVYPALRIISVNDTTSLAWRPANSAGVAVCTSRPVLRSLVRRSGDSVAAFSSRFQASMIAGFIFGGP